MGSNGKNWLAAGDMEYRMRPWIIAVLFFAAFEMYQWDHVSAAGALAGWLTPAGGNLHASETLIYSIGAAAALAAAALRTWAAAYMSSSVVHDPRVNDNRLVADGPYRYLRNPLYLGVILIACGVALVASRSGFVVLAVAVTFFQYRLIFREERALKATQGEGYRRYLAAVPRMIPSLRPCVPAGGMRPRWGQAFLGEMFMWAFAVTFVVFVATRNNRIFMWGCIGSTVLVLLMGRWNARDAAKQVTQ